MFYEKSSKVLLSSSDFLRDALFLLVVFLSPLLFSGSGKIPVFYVQTGILSASFLYLTSLCFSNRKPTFVGYYGVRLPFALFLLFIAYVFIQWLGGSLVFSKIAPGSLARYRTMDFLVQLVCYVLFFFLSLEFFSTRKRVRFFTFFLAATVIFLMALGYYQVHSQPLRFTKMYGIYPLAIDFQHFFYSSFFHKNQYGGYLVLASLFFLAAVLYFLEIAEKKVRIDFSLFNNLLYFVLLPVIFFSIYAAHARAAFFVEAFCLASVGIVAVSSKFRAKVLFIFSAIVLACFLYLVLNHANMFTKFSNMTITANIRFSVWQNLGRIFFDFPIFGTGLGTTLFISTSYQIADAGQLYYIYMMNYNLQLLTETGVVGYALFMSSLFILAITSMIKCFKSNSRWCHIYGLTSFAAVVATLIFCTGDDYLRVPAYAILFIVSLSILVKSAQMDIFPNEEIPQKIDRKIVVSPKRVGMWLISLVVLIQLFAHGNRSRLEFDNTHRAKGDPKILEKSVALRSQDALAWARLGDAYLKSSLQKSIKAYEKAVELAPTWPRGWHLLGRARIAAGDTKNGFKDIIHGVELAPYNRNGYLYLIVAYLRAVDGPISAQQRKEFRQAAMDWLKKASDHNVPFNEYNIDYQCNQRIAMPGWCPSLGAEDHRRVIKLIQEFGRLTT